VCVKNRLETAGQDTRRKGTNSGLDAQVRLTLVTDQRDLTGSQRLYVATTGPRKNRCRSCDLQFDSFLFCFGAGPAICNSAHLDFCAGPAICNSTASCFVLVPVLRFAIRQLPVLVPVLRFAIHKLFFLNRCRSCDLQFGTFGIWCRSCDLQFVSFWNRCRSCDS
jgi:hypothetical protein